MPQPQLNRRRILAALGALGAGPFVARALRSPAEAAAPAATPGLSCVLSPAMTDGPFFVDERLDRSDLTTGTSKAGVVGGMPLTLAIGVVGVRPAGCVPVSGVQIDVWHADATGEYSDVGRLAPSGATGQAYLRGYQVSDADGRVTFRTIYPGWYPGRTVHIHVKARRFDAAGNATYEFTTQLFFDDAISDVVMASAPYNARGTRNVRNAGDFIHGNEASAMVTLRRPVDGARGYLGSATLGLAMS